MQRRIHSTTIFILWASVTVAGAQTLGVGGRFVVRDGTGRKVGKVLTVGGECCGVAPTAATFTLTLDRTLPVVLTANRDSLSCDPERCDTDVFFESADCSGTPLINGGNQNPAAPSITGYLYVFAGPGMTLYYTASDTTPLNVAANSVRHLSDPCMTFGPVVGSWVPALSLDLGSRFTSPFRVTAK